MFTSWLFLGLGKCILPTTFVLTESFSASIPPRRSTPGPLQAIVDQTTSFVQNNKFFEILLNKMTHSFKLTTNWIRLAGLRNDSLAFPNSSFIDLKGRMLVQAFDWPQK